MADVEERFGKHKYPSPGAWRPSKDTILNMACQHIWNLFDGSMADMIEELKELEELCDDADLLEADWFNFNVPLMVYGHLSNNRAESVGLTLDEHAQACAWAIEVCIEYYSNPKRRT